MPEWMFTKDFVKDLLGNKKRPMKYKNTIPLKPPSFDELSVERIWPKIKKLPGMAAYFPDDLAPSRK